MRYNINSGHGKHVPIDILLRATGKKFIVGKSALAHRDMYQEIFRNDVDGVPRFADTIAGALSKCTANSGDTIFVLPGHTETVSGAAGIALDKAGVNIIGLGSGSTRPTITLDTAATASITVTAANITISNMIFNADFADITTCFSLANAPFFTLDRCYIKAEEASKNFLSVVTTNATTGNASGLTITNSKWIEPDTATLHLVNMAGTNADVAIEKNFVQLGVNNNKAALLNVANTKTVTNLRMVDNHVIRLNTDTGTGALLFHTNQSGNSGIVANNFAQHADTAGELLITATSGLSVFENYNSGVNGASGYILPARDS